LVGGNLVWGKFGEICKGKFWIFVKVGRFSPTLAFLQIKTLNSDLLLALNAL